VDADRQTWRRVLVAASVAGAIGLADVRAQAPESPYGGGLAKAVFMSDRVPEALAALTAKAPAAQREGMTAAAARAKELEPALATPTGADRIAAVRLERRRQVAQGMVALVATPEARAESVAASEALLPSVPSPVEDAQGIGIPLGLADLAEGYLKAHRESALTPYLYTYLMVQYRLAFERQASARALEGQKASARKYRTFRLRALASTDPLVKAVAQDIDALLYLLTPVPEHPGNFDPDACCRDK
jgi:hypothetical protein